MGRNDIMIETNLPIIFLRDLILFPYNELKIEFSSVKDKYVIDKSINKKKKRLNLLETPVFFLLLLPICYNYLKSSVRPCLSESV